MSRRARVLATVATVAMLVCVPARALASTTQVSMLMDDDQLIYVSQQHMIQTLERIKSLGVDVVKASVVWSLVAPDPNSRTKPNFDATDPGAYPAGAWTRYDDLVGEAQQLGLKVYFLLIGPAPDWATSAASGQGPSLGYAPNLTDFRQFVQAVGERYSGAYVPSSDPASTSSGSSSSLFGTSPLGITGATGVSGVTGSSGQTQNQPAPTQEPAIPRVNYWGVWNEPNERSWLNPWYRSLPHGGRALIQAQLYRGIVDAAWSGLASSDHSSDTIMIGETANRGIQTPAQFIRSLYCVTGNLKPLSGSAASNIGCPTSGSPASFANAHPGLFLAAGYSHHPYAFDIAPNRPYPDHTFITLDNIGSLERMLNGIFSTYGMGRRGGVPIYLTEWGYKTNPPNPFVKTSETQQAAWLDEGEYMTWADPFVNSLTQFLLVDSPPKPGEARGSALYWSTFQTGLELANGTAKPALAAYRIPIWLPVARHGPEVTVWGQLRPAVHTTTQVGTIEFEATGSTRWTELAEVQTKSSEGFLENHVSIPSAGQVRLAWADPSGTVLYSRSVAVS